MNITEERLREIIRDELGAALAPADERPVSAEELANYLRLSPYTVKQKAYWGYLPGFKIGREWRFYISEVRAKLSPPSVIDPWQQSSHSRAGHKAAATRARNARSGDATR